MASSPAKTDQSYDQSSPEKLDKGPEQPKNITFRFCRECSNMLYPKENKQEQVLEFACRTCHYVEQATTSCVYRNVLRNTVGETAGITQDVGQDPTVGPSNIPDFCTLCGQEIFCEICGQETDRGFWLEVPDEDVTGLRTPTLQSTTPTDTGNDASRQELLHNSQRQLETLRLEQDQRHGAVADSQNDK